LAHPVNSRQRITSVGFGAKRTLTELLTESGLPNEKTATLPAGVYFDALQVSFGDIVSPLWVVQILVAVGV
jgi:hypothetical protein